MQVRQRRARHVEVAADVGLQGLLQVRFGEVLQRLGVLLECGVVDEDVEAAERIDRLSHGALAECGVLDVAGDRDAARALLFDMATPTLSDGMPVRARSSA